MPRYIDADELSAAMYHEAFEKDSILQKWESGCWIRYKLFENVMKSITTHDVAEIVRCYDCKYYNGNNHYCDYDHYAVFNGYCYRGERREDVCN